jgi:NADH-quinone oxidoreductase subunit L
LDLAKIAFAIPLLPLLGFLINGLFGKRLPKPWPGVIGSLAVILSFPLCLLLLWDSTIVTVGKTFHFFEWIHVGSFQANFAYHIDPLTIVMLLTVSGVSSLIHIYSIGYMAEDRDYSRYFSYLNLFTAMMFLLVLAENLPLMFIGWEGVGLCSYLLIGFWYEKQAAADAGRKAFIVNRIGDAAFIFGMLLLYINFDTLSIQPILKMAPSLFEYGGATLTAITILLFIGAMGKSAQFPLHVWLPDAMEGPTPVSALIHAATMVTAGVYMICRLNMLYLMAPTTLWVVGLIATFTALFAALIAITQFDIKRVLAYSTISQLGYMFMACSVGAFGAAIFHLFTHAFFKALLFLGAGAVIHGLRNEMDMRKMGGLARSMPVVWITFLVGSMAISGFPFLAGFFSKDLILESTFINPLFRKIPLGVIGYITAIFTSFYMFRLYYRIFRGRYYGTSNLAPQRTSPVIAIPLVVLALLSIFAGFLAFPVNDIFGHFLKPVFENNLTNTAVMLGQQVSHQTSIPWTFWIISGLCFLVGWFFAFLFFTNVKEASEVYKKTLPRFYKALEYKLYIDDIYNKGLVQPGKQMFRAIWLGIDLGFIDAVVNGIGYWTLNLGRMCVSLSNGFIRSYAFYIVVGVMILIWIVQR